MTSTTDIVEDVVDNTVRDYIFCPENGVSVGMEYEKNQTPLKIKLAVAFCQEFVSLNKTEARSRLNDRLNRATKFVTDYPAVGPLSSNKYTTEVSYSGNHPKKEVLLPFLRYVSLLLVTQKRVKLLLDPLVSKKDIQAINKACKTKLFRNQITKFTLGPMDTHGALDVIQAQHLSACKTAQISIRGYKDVIWVLGQETALAKVQDANKKFVFQPLNPKVSNRLKKMLGWEPLFPTKVNDSIQQKLKLLKLSTPASKEVIAEAIKQMGSSKDHTTLVVKKTPLGPKTEVWTNDRIEGKQG